MSDLPSSGGWLTEGDSIGVGFQRFGGLQGNPVGGRNPQAVLDNINNNLQTNPNYYRGKRVLLSSGTMNDPSGTQHDLIAQQLQIIQNAGGQPVLAGADTGKFADRNKVLQGVAQSAGVPFAGPLPTSQVHPGPQGYSSYVRDVLSPLGRAPAVTPAPASVGPGSSAAPDLSTTPGRETFARQYLANALGLTPEQAAGAVRWMSQRESMGLQPSAFNPAGGGQGALGIAQWRGPRQQALIQQYGQQPSFQDQLKFLVSEMQGTEAPALRLLQAASTEPQAYQAYGAGFERPGPGELAKGGAADFSRYRMPVAGALPDFDAISAGLRSDQNPLLTTGVGSGISQTPAGASRLQSLMGLAGLLAAGTHSVVRVNYDPFRGAQPSPVPAGRLLPAPDITQPVPRVPTPREVTAQTTSPVRFVTAGGQRPYYSSSPGLNLGEHGTGALM